jgi:Transglutaminase-like superfamily
VWGSRSRLSTHDPASDRALAPGALWLCLRATLVLAALPMLLALLPVARVVRLLAPRHPLANRQSRLLEPAVRWVDRLVDLPPFHFWGHCLRRSLALYYVATRAGYPVRVAIGFRRVPASRGVTGHSWLELDGVPFHEPGADPERTFVVIHRLPTT